MRLINNKEFSEEDFDARLRFATEPVTRVTPLLQQVGVDLLEEMYKLNAVGLSANQVGLRMRVCAIDPAFIEDKKMPIIMFNPEIVECGEELYISPEGCLSLPGMGLQIPRFRNVKVRFLGLDGKEYTVSDDNSLLASVIQHEIDHLDGVLMTDRSLEEVTVDYPSV